jgi:hypothetical protein
MKLETYGETGTGKVKKLFSDISEKGEEKVRAFQIEQAEKKQREKQYKEKYKAEFNREKQKEKIQMLKAKARKNAYNETHRAENIKAGIMKLTQATGRAVTSVAKSIPKQTARSSSTSFEQPRRSSSAQGYNLGLNLGVSPLLSSKKSYGSPLLSRGVSSPFSAKSLGNFGTSPLLKSKKSKRGWL